MKIWDCEQGSSRWLQLRAGRPTASMFNRILTAGGKYSSQMESYANELIAERLMGRPLDTITMPWMARGTRLEAEARAYYEMQTGTTVEPVGFCTTDDGSVGCSPDGLVGDDGLLEIKCPSPEVHVYYLLGDPRGAGKDYMQQCQGQMLVTGRAYVDILSYFPGLPEALVRIERNDEYIKALKVGLDDLLALVAARSEKLSAKGLVFRLTPGAEEEQLIEEAYPDWLGVSDDDINGILEARITA